MKHKRLMYNILTDFFDTEPAAITMFARRPYVSRAKLKWIEVNYVE